MKSKYLGKFWNPFIKILLCPIVFFVWLCLGTYTQTTWFKKPKIKGFQGESWYNPYENGTNFDQKLNFHAHSKTWGGITNGKQSDHEVLAAYQKKGYRMAALSNYFSIADQPFSVYEHGINLKKSHRLVLLADEVVYFDYPFGQNWHQKQDMINRLREKGGYVVLAHPQFAQGHTETDFQKLVGYHFTEVVNHYRISEKEWDEGLRSGHLSWLLANDDTHDIQHEPTFQNWSCVEDSFTNPNELMELLLKGRHVGYHDTTGLTQAKLVHMKIQRDQLSFQFSEDVDSVRIVWDDGKNWLIGYKGEIPLLDKKFVRLVAYSRGAMLFTNPIVRFSKNKLVLVSEKRPEPMFLISWIWRFGTLLIWVISGKFIFSWLFNFRNTISFPYPYIQRRKIQIDPR